LFQVFSKTVICRDLDVGNNTARNHNLDCVTLDGDQVNKKGAMTGGYHDSRSSRLKLIKAIKTGMQKQQELMEELKTVKASIQNILYNCGCLNHLSVMSDVVAFPGDGVGGNLEQKLMFLKIVILSDHPSSLPI
jgi:hypothetical protein